MRSKIKGILLLMLVFLLFMQCAISKRHYRKGYQIVWNKKTAKTEKYQSKTLQPTQTCLDEENTIPSNDLQQNEPELSAAADETRKLSFANLKTKTQILVRDSCGDLIVFRDGTEQSVKIIEVLNGVIKYLPCDNLIGPIRISKSENIFMIRYANGLKEVFKDEVKPVQPIAVKQKSQNKKTNGFAAASFICAMFGIFVIPGVVALVLGTVALHQIKEQPDKYKGKWMAVTGVIVGGIVTSILALLILFNH